MGNSLRCCLACVLPCGPLDLIRIVHNNGHVDQYSHTLPASEILSVNPNHVLTKLCSDATSTSRRRIIIVSPDSDLKRGSIYFLVPSSSLSQNLMKKKRKTVRNGHYGYNNGSSEENDRCRRKSGVNLSNGSAVTAPVPAEINKHMQRHRRSGRVGAWRQQLESIAED